MLQQSGGANSTSFLTIGPGGQYQFTGGTLQVSTALLNQGVVNGNNRPATLSANCLVDLTAGTWRNLQGTSMNMGANGLLIVPAGFNTATGLAGLTTAGLPVHVAGTTLTVPAGQGFSGWGTINDPVVCQGTIAAAANGAINLNNGLVVSGNGNVNLSSTSGVTVNDAVSGMTGGTLSTGTFYIGNRGTGTFTQSGGIISLPTDYTSGVVLGNNPGDTGTYNLSGTGRLTTTYNNETVGNSGTGVFNQSGGTNAPTTLVLAANAGSTGTYTLSGTGHLIDLLREGRRFRHRRLQSDRRG